jgi:hypothetical protein
MSSPTMFYNTLVEFLRALTQRFPENTGAKTALSSLQMLGSNPQLHPQMSASWAHSTKDILQEIKDKNAEVVAKALDSNDNPLISGINASSILLNDSVDEITKENMWKFLQALTALSHTKPEPTDVAVPAPVARPMAGPGESRAAPAAKPDVGNIVDGFTKAMPKVMDSLNEMLKSKEGENPLADMIKQMMNPNQVQPGVAGNVMQNMIEQTDSTVMQQAALQTGLSVDDIVYRLSRLENLEKSRAYRRQLRRQGGSTKK